MMPRKTVSERMQVVPSTTKALVPNGGVTITSSMNLTIKMHSHISSKPNFRATGKSNGTEIMSSDNDSNTMPNGIRLSSRISIANRAGISQDNTASVIIFGTRAAIKNEDKMPEPITM